MRFHIQPIVDGFKTWSHALLRSSMFALAILTSAPAAQAANYHLVGWVNTFIPGAGQMLLGNYGYGAFQAGAEVGTFMAGYNMSAKSPFTLDGVPEQVPTLDQAVQNGTTGVEQDITPSLNGDILQEIGIKYHMVNVYDAYRKAGANGGQGVDNATIPELFAAPFHPNLVFDRWVIWPLLISLGYHAYSYSTEGTTNIARLNSASVSEYQYVYGVVYPVGSAAPEEMFYRGFLQNEVHALFGTPFVSVPISAAAYTFSHEADSRFSAAVSGLYLGALTASEKGKLGKPIAFHFWSDVIMGIHAIASLLRNQNAAPAVNAASAQGYYFTWQWGWH